MNPQNSFNLPSIDCKELPLIPPSNSFRFASPSIIRETNEQLTDVLQSQKSKYLYWFQADKNKIGLIYKKEWGEGKEKEGKEEREKMRERWSEEGSNEVGNIKKEGEEKDKEIKKKRGDEKNQESGEKKREKKNAGINEREEDDAKRKLRNNNDRKEIEAKQKEIKIEFQNSEEKEVLMNSINSSPITTSIPTLSFLSPASSILFFSLPNSFPCLLPSPLPFLPAPFPIPPSSFLPLSNVLALLPPFINLRCLSLFFMFKLRLSEESAFSILLRTDLSLTNPESVLIRLEKGGGRTSLLLARRVGRMGEYECLKKCEVPWKDEEKREKENGRRDGRKRMIEKEEGEREGKKKRDQEDRREVNRRMEQEEKIKREGGNKSEEEKRGRMKKKEEIQSKNEREKEEIEFDIRKLREGGEIELNANAKRKNGKKWKNLNHKCKNYKSSCDSDCSTPPPTSSSHSPFSRPPPFLSSQNCFPLFHPNISSSVSPSSISPSSVLHASSFLPPSSMIPPPCVLHPPKTWILEGLDSGDETLSLTLQKEGSNEKFIRKYEGLRPYLGDFRIYIAGEGTVEVGEVKMEIRKRKKKEDERDDEEVSKCRCQII